MFSRDSILIQQPYAVMLLLFCITLLALFPGIGELTGITGKDEYLLTIRTPMHMIEGDHGWLPWLDGQPRLKKPPLLYWLGKLSYEWFGVSLISARMIGVGFAALLVTSTAGLAWLLFRRNDVALFAGLVLLGMAGIMIDGRRYLLDIPVAALSVLSVLTLLYWDKTRSVYILTLSMISLGLAFLAKGPVCLIFYFTALIARLFTRSGSVEHRFDWRPWLIFLLIPLGMVASWYGYLYQLYPEKLVGALIEEAEGRDLLRISIDPLLNLLVIALPWSPAAFFLVARSCLRVPGDSTRRNNLLFLVYWLILSLLPFFFFKTFSRYLYGLLVPLALVVSHLVVIQTQLLAVKYWLRAGAILSVTIGIPIILFVAWFRSIDVPLLLTVAALILFVYTWWQAHRYQLMSVTAIVFWVSLTSIVYPRMNINALPDGINDTIKDEYTVLYAGPQPAMLPAATGKGLRATSRLWTLPAEVLGNCRGFLLYMPDRMLDQAKKQMLDLELDYEQLDRFKILSSRGSWLYFAKAGTTLNDWKRAIRDRDIDSLGTDILLIRAMPRHCEK